MRCYDELSPSLIGASEVRMRSRRHLLSGDTCIGQALHQEQRRLAMMDMGPRSAAVRHLGLVDRVDKRAATSLLQRLPVCRAMPSNSGFGMASRTPGLPRRARPVICAGLSFGTMIVNVLLT